MFQTKKGGRDCAAIGVPQAQEAAISPFPICSHPSHIVAHRFSRIRCLDKKLTAEDTENRKIPLSRFFKKMQRLLSFNDFKLLPQKKGSTRTPATLFHDLLILCVSLRPLR
jgi:hypothetical protein